MTIKINYITNYKNESIFDSNQYGHYSEAYRIAKKKLSEKNIILVENILDDIHRDLFTNITDINLKITHLAMYCAYI
jgi:dihydroneopterin aldolase